MDFWPRHLRSFTWPPRWWDGAEEAQEPPRKRLRRLASVEREREEKEAKEAQALPEEEAPEEADLQPGAIVRAFDPESNRDRLAEIESVDEPDDVIELRWIAGFEEILDALMATGRYRSEEAAEDELSELHPPFVDGDLALLDRQGLAPLVGGVWADPEHHALEDIHYKWNSQTKKLVPLVEPEEEEEEEAEQEPREEAAFAQFLSAPDERAFRTEFGRRVWSQIEGTLYLGRECAPGAAATWWVRLFFDSHHGNFPTGVTVVHRQVRPETHQGVPVRRACGLCRDVRTLAHELRFFSPSGEALPLPLPATRPEKKEGETYVAHVGGDCAARLVALSRLAKLLHDAHAEYQARRGEVPREQLRQQLANVESALEQLLATRAGVRRKYEHRKRQRFMR